MCIDLLTPEAYLRAGERLARHYADLVRRALRTMPWLLALLLLLLAAVVLVLIVIPGSAVARTATAVAAIAGTFSGIWKLIRTRVAPIAAQLEKPLWGTELNTATAEAVTCSPVGAPQDPALETAFEQMAADVITAATQGQPARHRLCAEECEHGKYATMLVGCFSQAELQEYLCYVCLDGALGHEQPGGDRPVRHAFGNEGQHLSFSLGESGEGVHPTAASQEVGDDRGVDDGLPICDPPQGIDHGGDVE